MENHELISFGDLPVSDLMHYGTLGMKWGVRRYQNKDGSLTAAGKKRRAKLEAELDKLGGKKSNGEPETPKPKTVGEMSDAELREAVNRLQLEKQFRTLQSEMNPKKVSAGKEFVGKLGKKLGDAAAEAAGSAGKTFMEKKLKEVLGVDEKKVKTAYEQLKEKVEMEELKTKMKLMSRDWKSVAQEYNNMSDEEVKALSDAVERKNQMDRLLTIGEKKK